MLQVSPATPISDGYFVFDVFGDRIICRKGVSENPDGLPDAHIVDKWSIIHDDKAGFSWDAFLAASANQGRSVLDERLEPPQKLTRLIDDLNQQLIAVIAAKQSLPVIAFCEKVKHLDSNLYALARKHCLMLIEDQMAEAMKSSDLPTAIGIGLTATKAGFESEVILTGIKSCTATLVESEKNAEAAVADLSADMDRAGTEIASFTRNEYVWLSSLQGLTLTDTRVNYVAKTWGSQASTWMGAIIGFRPTKQDGLAYKAFGVYMDASYTLDQGFNFATETERDQFLVKATTAWNNWKEKWREKLTVEVTARPNHWSERVFVVPRATG